MDVKEMIRTLFDDGMCTIDGYPISIKRLFCADAKDIVLYGNQVLRGILNGKQGCDNFYEGWQLQYIVQYSIAKTLARKYDISMKKVFKKYGNKLTVSYKNAKGEAKSIYLALYISFRRDKYFLTGWLKRLKESVVVHYNDANPLSRKCYICGNPHQQHMFHRKKKSRMKSPYTHVQRVMVEINRRQICLCRVCFTKAENNQFEYNQITKRKPILKMESRVH